MSPSPDHRPQGDPTRPVGAWQIGRIAGVPVYVAGSWFVGALFLVGLFAIEGSGLFSSPASTIAFGVAVVIVLFASVAIHEAAHALAAQAFNHRVLNITFSFWGGATRYVAYRPRPLSAALIALAGPAANFTLAALGFAATYVAPPGGLGVVLTAFVGVNLVLGIYNALPGLPLDGGQVTSGIAWAITRSHTSGIVAGAWAGRVIVLVVAAYFLFQDLHSGGGALGLVWTLMITVMLWQATTTQFAVARQRRQLDNLTVSAVARPAALLPDSMPSQLAMAYARPGSAFVLHNHTRITGVVTGFWQHCPAPLAPIKMLAMPVGPEPLRCAPDEPVTDLAIAMQSEQRPAVVVRYPDGGAGVLVLDDILLSASQQVSPQVRP